MCGVDAPGRAGGARRGHAEKVRVLFVDGYPRWEYRFLKELLKRADENIQVQVVLLSASPDFRQESTRGVEALREVPSDRKTLLESYDVVILGDVSPYAISPDPARCDEGDSRGRVERDVRPGREGVAAPDVRTRLLACDWSSPVRRTSPCRR